MAANLSRHEDRGWQRKRRCGIWELFWREARVLLARPGSLNSSWTVQDWRGWVRWRQNLSSRGRLLRTSRRISGRSDLTRGHPRNTRINISLLLLRCPRPPPIASLLVIMSSAFSSSLRSFIPSLNAIDDAISGRAFTPRHRLPPLSHTNSSILAVGFATPSSSPTSRSLRRNEHLAVLLPKHLWKVSIPFSVLPVSRLTCRAAPARFTGKPL